MSEPTHVTFMRHDRSGADDEGVHEGRYDSPLTSVGRDQALARALDFKSQRLAFDRIICSPLQRAHETASILGETLSVAIEVDSDWMEMDNGPLAGLPRAQAAALYPEPAFRNPFEPICGTGESEWALYRRAATALEAIVRRPPGRYLVVAHGGSLNAALRPLAGLTPGIRSQGLVFAFGETGYAQFSYDPDRHSWQLTAFRAA